ncbi:MAG: hypothetical protein ACJA2M_002185 [Polaribacter sp.]|jgi:hypothetical protein
MGVSGHSIMKIYSKLFLITLSILTIGCSDNLNLKEFNLKSLNTTIELSSSYKIVGKKELSAVVYKEQDSQFRTELFGFLEQYPDDVLIVDTLNPYKFIVISDIKPSFKIDSIAFIYLVSKARLASSSEPKIDSTYYVGSRMGETNGLKFLESKYQLYDGINRQRISYSFIITSKQTTIQIVFNSPKDQNIIQSIKSMIINN